MQGWSGLGAFIIKALVGIYLYFECAQGIILI